MCIMNFCRYLGLTFKALLTPKKAYCNSYFRTQENVSCTRFDPVLLHAWVETWRDFAVIGRGMQTKPVDKNAGPPLHFNEGDALRLWQK